MIKNTVFYLMVKDPKYLSFKTLKRYAFINSKATQTHLKVGIYAKFLLPNFHELNIWNNEKNNNNQNIFSIIYFVYFYT